MRLAKISVVIGAALFGGGATAVLASWTLAAGCLLLALSAVFGAVAMEDRDLAAVEGLAPDVSLRMAPGEEAPSEATTLEAA